MRDTDATWWWLGLSVVLLTGCADAAPDTTECALPPETAFEITSVELQTDLSNTDCPVFEATDLDEQLLKDEACEQRVDNCSVLLTCELDSLTVNGKLYEKDGQLRGRIDVRSPIVCVYFIDADFL